MTSSRSSFPLFHRRLLLLVAVMVLVFGAMTLQVVRLSVVQGEQHRRDAEARLDRRTYLPTWRGDIVDRNGRRLATDSASYGVAVHYDLITGSWQDDQAVKAARRRVGAATWEQMGPEQRERELQASLPEFEAIATEVWTKIQLLGGLSIEELTQRRDAIRAEVHALRSAVWEAQRGAWEARERRRQQALTARLEDDDRTFKPQAIREERAYHVILPRVSDEIAFEFRRLAERFPAVVQVQDATRRHYPLTALVVEVDRSTLPMPLRDEAPLAVTVEGVADHLLGSMREGIWREDVQRRPFVEDGGGAVDLGGYRHGDSVGTAGLEQVFEDHLRGRRGVIIEHQADGTTERIEPQPGRDLQLSIDVLLQARVQALLAHEVGLTVVQPWHQNPVLPAGRPLNSAAVVLDVATGEVLAAVSMPTLAMGARLDEAQRARDQPLVFRPAEAVYPPGSIIKPLVLCAAVTEGVHGLGQTVHCRGHYFEHDVEHARCWIYRPRYEMTSHGDLGAAEAMARSCNIYFYTLADRLGMPALSDWFGRFGLGQLLHAGLDHEERWPMRDEHGDVMRGDDGAVMTRPVIAGEAAGSLPGPGDVELLRRRGTLHFSTIITGIGQGPVTWTPLQAANAYAIIGRDGAMGDATMLLGDPRGTRPQRADLPLRRELVDTVLEGLRQSVQERHGSGYHIVYDEDNEERIITAKGVTVWAKTGTAQAPPLREDTNGDGAIDELDEPIVGLDHAWFVGLVGPKGASRPLVSIAVMVEYGGSGGRVAGPIANQIIKALQQEHYLP